MQAGCRPQIFGRPGAGPWAHRWPTKKVRLSHLRSRGVTMKICTLNTNSGEGLQQSTVQRSARTSSGLARSTSSRHLGIPRGTGRRDNQVRTASRRLSSMSSTCRRTSSRFWRLETGHGRRCSNCWLPARTAKDRHPGFGLSTPYRPSSHSDHPSNRVQSGRRRSEASDGKRGGQAQFSGQHPWQVDTARLWPRTRSMTPQWNLPTRPSPWSCRSTPQVTSTY